MPHSNPSQSIGSYLGMALACLVTIVIAIMIVRSAPLVGPSSAKAVQTKSTNPSLESIDPGVRGKITAGPITITRSLPAMAFALQQGQSLDARVPAGPFECEFTVTFLPGETRQAKVGAIIQNGQLIVKRGEQVVLASAAGNEPVTALGNDLISLGRRAQQLTYWFKTDGKQPCRLRAIWQPVESKVPLPLPSDGASLVDDDSLRGMVVFQQFNCAACHVSADANLQQQLTVNPGPILGEIGSRARPNWIRKWLADPQIMKPGAAMPQLFHGAVNDQQTIEDLTHFLVSLGGPIQSDDALPDPDIVSTGMVNYHTVGCVACHGALEPLEKLPGERVATGASVMPYTPLGELGMKTTLTALSGFLRDPVKVRPGGRMPGQNLSELEADSIAAYLMARDRQRRGVVKDQPFHVDPLRAERGKAQFAKLGCANCHSMGSEHTAIASTLTAPTLESMAGAKSNAGCLSITSDGKSPLFSMDESQRKAAAAFLQSLSSRRNDNVPLDHLAVDMARLNCTACHQYQAERGPEIAVLPYFVTVVEADLGDEGRVPPNLGDVGAKLNPNWLNEVLTGDARVRPYMGTRMPHFGENNMTHFSADFAAAAGADSMPDHGPASTSEYATIGRELVGSKALNCIQCHVVNNHDATGTPGPDLARMAERLRFDAFSRWLHDPKLMRPGTRMPSFFVNGMGGFTQFLDGDADRQVQAIWAYLSQGEFMPLPDGLVDASSLELSVTNEPIVFRTFIKSAGVRAIACGYPEQVHCAFDSEKCRLALVWQGSFLNAKGAWAARGGTETNPPPKEVQWKAPKELLLRLVTEPGKVEEPTPRFKGYQLDAQRRPIFMYELAAGNARVDVKEQPLPKRVDTRGSLTRHFEVQGPADLMLLVNTQGLRFANASVPTKDRGDGTVEMTLNSQGDASFELEVTW